MEKHTGLNDNFKCCEDFSTPCIRALSTVINTTPNKLACCDTYA